jgi:hypothetical protein
MMYTDPKMLRGGPPAQAFGQTRHSSGFGPAVRPSNAADVSAQRQDRATVRSTSRCISASRRPNRAAFSAYIEPGRVAAILSSSQSISEDRSWPTTLPTNPSAVTQGSLSGLFCAPRLSCFSSFRQATQPKSRVRPNLRRTQQSCRSNKPHHSTHTLFALGGRPLTSVFLCVRGADISVPAMIETMPC